MTAGHQSRFYLTQILLENLNDSYRKDHGTTLTWVYDGRTRGTTSSFTVIPLCKKKNNPTQLREQLNIIGSPDKQWKLLFFWSLKILKT